MNPQRGIAILRCVLGVVVGGYSVALVVSQLRGEAHHALLLLGLAELVAAILFLIPRTLRIGGISLIVVFAIAAVFHLLHREFNIGSLVVYAAAAFAVLSNRRTI